MRDLKQFKEDIALIIDMVQCAIDDDLYYPTIADAKDAENAVSRIRTELERLTNETTPLQT